MTRKPWHSIRARPQIYHWRCALTITFAYCTARWPRPPPAPDMIIHSPAFNFARLTATYDVTPVGRVSNKQIRDYCHVPPHIMGPASSSRTPSGILVVYLPSLSAYCWNVPGTFTAVFSCFVQNSSCVPLVQKSHSPQVLQTHLIPALSPTFHL
jgi:hypothetical protein